MSASRPGAPRRTARPRWRLAARVLTALVVLAAVGSGLTGAQAAPGGVHADTGPIPPITSGNDDAARVIGWNTVVKAKTIVNLTPIKGQTIVLRVYANQTSVHTPKFLYGTSPAWVVTNPGPHPLFGDFPAAPTAVLAFGAIKVTATIHLSQLIGSDGYLIPLVIKTKGGLTPPYPVYPTTVSGPVDLRLDDVVIGGVPLDVGTDCHSATPVQLSLAGIAPKYGLFTGGPLDGTITIPPFTGCHNGTEDLDPLFTGTLSGPGNPLHMVQGQLGGWNTSKPNDCTGCTKPSGQPPPPPH